MELEQRILDAYREGSDLGYIQQCFNLSEEEIRKVLINYKDRNHYKRTFTDDFKKLIAERDLNNVSRRQIISELSVSANTVKQACKQFGQLVKRYASSENEYTIVKGVHNLDCCPSCKNKRVNNVESIESQETVFCMNCHGEFFKLKGNVYQVNWEYVD